MTVQNTKKRLMALDIFRGLTMMAMIIVNSPDTFGELSHAYWIGVNFADLIFPFFILIVGVSISLGFRNVDKQNLAPVTQKILKRTVIMFAIGMVVNLFYTHFEQIRVLGVLQRIALVYCACCFLTIYCSTRQLVKLGAAILFTYWIFILIVPAPGLEAGQLERGKNIINWFDQFMPGMLWRGDWDPEGLLSTFPAIVTGIIGVLMGRIVMSKESLTHQVMQLFLLGFGLFCLGCIWSLAFPMIKQIWSSTFVLVTGGLGAMSLAAIVWYTDMRSFRWGTYLPLVFGANAISAYVIHVVIEKILDWKIGNQSVHDSYVAAMSSAGFSEITSITLWVIVFFAVCTVPVWWLYHKKIFIKI
ncbi:hypothetical protein JYB87_13040 [Shewanella avicenniae]|uniref:Heparan-alpha-glucosaminide N-acetyltransferase catalytic domain-containing protein n=1 Tax=Shewanella avicenniae TaxID=2814294 RepID=A0ABX7QML2_9GAMM|nr:hypothetical protein [Shewanella avicenniae]QSX32671.1 hypothetical protein JYB87_13040 [Shewanella avicenniae]